MKKRESILSKMLALIYPAAAFSLYIDGDGDGGTDTTDETPPAGNNDLVYAEDGGVVGTGNATRLAMMARINDQNEAKLAADFVDVVDIDGGVTTPFVPNKTPPDDPAAPQGNEASGTGVDDKPSTLVPTGDEVDGEGDTTDVAAAPPPPPAAPPPPEPVVTKIKVNGVEVELTPELIAKAQKVASADSYMEEAAAALRRVTAPAPTPSALPPSPEDVEAARLEEERALVRAIQVGTEDEALVALRKIRGSSASSLTPDQVAAITDERVAFKEAINWFNGEFKDLVSDPRLHKIVQDTDAQLVEAGDKRTYRERYEAIGTDVRKWRDSVIAAAAPKPPPPAPPAAPTPPAPAPLADKLARKAAAPSIPTLASARSVRAADPDDDNSPEDASKVIAQMAKSRGGPQWARN